MAVTPPTDALRPLSGSVADVWRALRRWWEDPDGPVVVRTSGSTGRPKDVALSHGAVRYAAHAGLERLGGPGRWLLALPATNVAGLMVLARSLASGTEPVVADGSLVEAVDRLGAGRTYVSVVPTQLHRLDRDGDLGVLARFDAVLVGGAPADPGLLGRARAAGAAVVTTYGASETCGGCVYDGVPLDGVEVRVGHEGRVLLRGPLLFDGYADDAAATADVLVDGWFRTGDIGRLDGSGRLEVLGRADDVVLSGGVAVHLAAVEQAVLSHPAVAAAAVTALDDPEWGSRVVAVVVADGTPPSVQGLRDHVAGTLPRTWAPQSIGVADALPLLPGGKVDRQAVRALAARI